MNESNNLLETKPLSSEEKSRKSHKDDHKKGNQGFDKHTLPSKFVKEIKDAIQGWAGSKVKITLTLIRNIIYDELSLKPNTNCNKITFYNIRC